MLLAETAATDGVSNSGDAASFSIANLFHAIRAQDAEAVMGMVVAVAVPAVLALLALFVGYLAAKFLARVVSGPVCKRVDETLGRFAARFVFNGVMVCTAIGVASTVGINVTSFAAVLAAAGFAIGMAFQGTLSNFAAGILLLVFRPFKVGDMVNAAGVMGKVHEIDLFTTKLDTPDNRRIIVPNSAVSGATIENVTFHAHRRVEVLVGVAYSASIAETRQTLTAAAETLRENLVDGEGRGYMVILSDLGSSSVNWMVRFWTPSNLFFATREKLTEAVKNHLDAAAIPIAFPQLDVHLDGLELAQESRLGGAESHSGSPQLKVRPRLRHRAA
jgi:small conductance mechanosensitive channel